jgi:predicted anti-sigma-YlaC factor YlaD
MSRRNGRVRCEDVRELLPEYAEPGPRPAGAVEVHLASCAACRAELDSYRELLSDLAAYAEVEVAVPDGYLEASLRTARSASLRNRIPGRVEIRAASTRAVDAVRRHGTGVRYAAATIGGAAAGATAIAIVWWSIARRAMPGAGAL